MDHFFRWTSELSVGETVIDLQHKQLINQINVLLSSMVNDLETKAIDEAINFLGQYIDGHLKYEEEYMIKNEYPDLIHHQAAHKNFIENYEHVKEKRAAGAPLEVIALDIEQYLGNWFIYHIGHDDHQYAEFIRQKNA